MPRAAKPTRLPGSGKVSPATEADFFVKQGDFQFLAAGRPAMFYRNLDKARADWLGGWREFFQESFPSLVGTIDVALGTTPEAEEPPTEEPPAEGPPTEGPPSGDAER